LVSFGHHRVRKVELRAIWDRSDNALREVREKFDLSLLVQEGWLRTKVIEPVSHWMNQMIGKIGAWLNSIKDMVSTWITDVLLQVAGKLVKWLGDQYNRFDQWCEDVTRNAIIKLLKIPDPMIWAVKTMGKAIVDYILQPIRNISDAWQQFLDLMKPTGPDGTFVGGGGGTGTVGGGGSWGAPKTFRGGPPAGFTPSPGDMTRAETYGPQSQGATAADMRQLYGATVAGRKIPLQTGVSAAISPSLPPVSYRIVGG
jgi:hypothetical protein